MIRDHHSTTIADAAREARDDHRPEPQISRAELRTEDADAAREILPAPRCVCGEPLPRVDGWLMASCGRCVA